METWFTILGWTLSIAAAAGNGSIIFLVCKKRRLLTKTNAFIISLAVADLGVGACVFPSEFFSEIVKTSHNSSSNCNNIRLLIRWLFSYASVTSLCSLILDRYVAIVKPLNYLNFMSRGRVIQMIFVSWAIPVGFDITSILLPAPVKCNFVNIFGMFWESFSCCFLIFCFSSMILVVYKHDRSSAILAKQLRFNHRGLTVSSQDRSAVTMMAIVIVVFLVCYGIYLRCSIVALFHNLKCNDTDYKIPMLVLNSAINPWAYAFFKRDIKKEMIKKLICRKTKKKLQNQ
ncbi:unnamed protein product [Porites lobata]|uniref:G-protein coupled receptors family 1 profile domain-containing protein n=1 Tax=Porites lobata TaxID=104759 RepID=A0ABN8N234_9CNID|nr:unnamed protein product [Porites lobata]